MVYRSVGLCLLVILAVASITFASSGDRAQVYQSCLSHCESHECSKGLKLPFSLRFTRWTCLDDCKYRCMHYITDLAEQAGARIEQYHGKWPFWRLAGMQEPASVAFSIFNLLFHWRGLERVLGGVPDGHPMKGYYVTFAAVSINAWIWSSVFHTRDTPITEKLDYFSAALAIMYALYYSSVRLFHLYPSTVTQQSHPSRRQTIRRGLATVCTVAFLGHVSYLTLLPRFDYAYNMAFNLGVGITHNLLWLMYSFPAFISVLHRFPARPKSYRPSYAWKAATFVLLTTAATALELFDFPPWQRTIDAHSLWHMSTAPIVAFWYEFLIQDAQDDGWQSTKPE